MFDSSQIGKSFRRPTPTASLSTGLVSAKSCAEMFLINVCIFIILVNDNKGKQREVIDLTLTSPQPPHQPSTRASSHSSPHQPSKQASSHSSINEEMMHLDIPSTRGDIHSPTYDPMSTSNNTYFDVSESQALPPGNVNPQSENVPDTLPPGSVDLQSENNERPVTYAEFNYTMNIFNNKMNTVYELCRFIGDQQREQTKNIKKLITVDELSDEFWKVLIFDYF